MEVDDTVHAEDGNTGRGSVSVLLHPIVLLSISEHWMRERLAKDSISVNVFGALLGKQNGSNVEVSSSFELLLDENLSIDVEFFNGRESQCKQIYPDLDLVGWYTTGGTITDADKIFNCQMREINESLLIVKLDPLDRLGEQLPLRVYESVVDNDANVLIKKVSYSLAHEETERIGVDHVARVSGCATNKESSLTAEYLMSNYQAVQMLSRRLHLLKAYVDSVIKGELPTNFSRLREISAALQRLPTFVSSLEEIFPKENVDPSKVQNSSDKLLRQANDVCLTALLGSLTQSMHTLHSWLSQSSQSISKHSDNGSSFGYLKHSMAFNEHCSDTGGNLVYMMPAGEDNL